MLFSSTHHGVDTVRTWRQNGLKQQQNSKEKSSWELWMQQHINQRLKNTAFKDIQQLSSSQVVLNHEVMPQTTKEDEQQPILLPSHSTNSQKGDFHFFSFCAEMSNRKCSQNQIETDFISFDSIPAPEVYELTSEEAAKKACENKPLCIVSVLPHILDCDSKCRNDFINILKSSADKFKKQHWGWLWTEGGAQPHVEEALEIGGFGYPAMAAVNYKKLKYTSLRGSFSADGIYEFLRDISFGRGQTAPVRGAAVPKVNTVEPWDGKDGQLPEEEDIDLSDVVLDDKDEL